jgi:pantoate--beta-alanine ligase
MEVIRTIGRTFAWCERESAAGGSVGLVPTMGALHAGHGSLISRARSERDRVVVSIFVNPLQFDRSADLAAYPRDEERDLAMCERLGVDVVFVPSAEAMYPDGHLEVTVDPGPLGERLEGASRAGHFRGVATVVAKLFHAVGPCAAYFGEKDAQQLAVIRRMARDLSFPVEVVPCQIVREPGGLALSSRNERLTAEQRDAASCLFSGLAAAAELARAGERDVARLVAVIAREVGATSQARLGYAAVVDDETFEEVGTLDGIGRARALVAAWFGDVRLIDNLALPIPSR